MITRKCGTSVPSLEISKVPAGTRFLLECERTVSTESASNGESDWENCVVGLEEIKVLANGGTPRNLSAFQKFVLSFKSTAESRYLGENPTYLMRTAKKDNAKISFDMHGVGDLLELNAKKNIGMLVRRGGFLAAQVGVIIGIHTINDKTLSLALGNVPYMQRISGNGKYWLEVQGDLSEVIHLQAGEEIFVDPLKLVALTENVKMELVSTSDDKAVRMAEGRDYHLHLKSNVLDGIVYMASLPQTNDPHGNNSKK